MKLLLLVLSLFSLSAQASWLVNSEFRLHVGEEVFNQLVARNWKTLQKDQALDLGNFTVTPNGIPIQIRSVKAFLQYQMRAPARSVSGGREWDVQSVNVAAKITVDAISATQTILREVNGVQVRVKIQADCKNVVLRLPPGKTAINAQVSAEILDGKVNFSLPALKANWAPGSWQVESMQCTGVEGFGELLRTESLKALASYENFDAQVRSALQENILRLNQNATLALLAERELPSPAPGIKLLLQPKQALDKKNGVQVLGNLQFDFLRAAPGKKVVNSYFLEEVREPSTNSTQMVVPFAAARAFLLGEFQNGNLDFSLKSTQIPGFREFQNSFWQVFWGWPELLEFDTNAIFQFRLAAASVPVFSGESAAGDGVIAGKILMPVSLRMFGPMEGAYKPMVDFKFSLSGPVKMKLGAGGEVAMRVSASASPIRYEWVRSYLARGNVNTKIETDSLAEKLISSLNAEGVRFRIPTLVLGEAGRMNAQRWQLEEKNLRVFFAPAP